ncbi:MAG TPA: hypothetical protein VMZ30_10880 [Pyrinomonadaceae bacterium]|nr:hypothetical protein [Pyrinomonadaceae bacterium]
MINDPDSLGKAINKLYFQSFGARRGLNLHYPIHLGASTVAGIATM